VKGHTPIDTKRKKRLKDTEREGARGANSDLGHLVDEGVDRDGIKRVTFSHSETLERRFKKNQNRETRDLGHEKNRLMKARNNRSKSSGS